MERSASPNQLPGLTPLTSMMVAVTVIFDSLGGLYLLSAWRFLASGVHYALPFSCCLPRSSILTVFVRLKGRATDLVTIIDAGLPWRLWEELDGRGRDLWLSVWPCHVCCSCSSRSQLWASLWAWVVVVDVVVAVAVDTTGEGGYLQRAFGRVLFVVCETQL